MQALEDVAKFLGYKEQREVDDSIPDESYNYDIPAEEFYNTACAENSESVRKRLVRRIK